MTTVGTSKLSRAAFDFFDGLRSYDVKRAGALLADDAEFQSPWSGGHLHGKTAIEAHLASWLGDAKGRPSLTIADLLGDANSTTLTVSVSGRFGQNPMRTTWSVLCLSGKVHTVAIRDANAPAAAH